MRRIGTPSAARRWLAASVVVGAGVGAALLPTGDAVACGACFVPPESSTVVSGHRMVLSVSPVRTVLWDQIQYQGDPTEFAWVLPVKPGAVVEQSTDAFFEVLESATQRKVQGPPVNCGGGLNFGCGFTQATSGNFAAEDGAGGGSGQNPVTVVHQGTVGPYETVTLHSSQSGALNTWLTQHNYNVDATAQPIIDAYVAEGFDFIALRLLPGKGVNQMTPVRVVSDGASPTMPLRMVQIGTGATVPIVLYVIGEGRWTTQNFPEESISQGLLTWDYSNNTSNYADLRAAALQADGGKGFLTAYAVPGTLSGYLGYDPTTYESVSFAGSYFDQAQKNGETTTRCTPPNAYASYTTIPNSGLVVDPCPAGAPPGSPECAPIGAGQVDVHDLGCADADDIGAATLGMHLEDVWVTRLEATLPHDALDTDLQLKAAKSQQPVSQTAYAQLSKHADQACGATFVPVTIGKSDDGSKTGWWFAAGAIGVALSALQRRRRSALFAAPKHR